MKRRNIFCLLILAVVLLMTGCGAEQKKEKSYTVYYVNSAGTKLVESSYSPAAETFEEMLEELIGQLATAPSGNVSALPSEVKFNGYERSIDALRLDFSKEYYDLTNIEEVLLRAAVVKTVCQIPGVTKVMITVEKEQLKDSEGELVPAMDGNTFIDTKEGGINSYLYATLHLYFATKDGDYVSPEVRNFHYSSNMVLERVVVEQLIKGPETSGLKPVLDESVRIQNIYTQNGICTINFDESINKAPSENPPDAEAALYAIVNSICQTCDSISGVKIEINGDSDVKFRGEVELGQIFMMNQNFIEHDEIQTEENYAQDEAQVQAAETGSSNTGSSDTEAPIPETVSAETAASEAENLAASQTEPGSTIAGVDPSIKKE